jgi:citrate lyase beta subunit
MKTSLSRELLQPVVATLGEANAAFSFRYPGDTPDRQPVHTFYGAADLFRSDTAAALGAHARRSLQTYASNFAVFARAFDLPGAPLLPTSESQLTSLRHQLQDDPGRVRHANRAAWFAHTVAARVAEKLRREPVEDCRIDFEDGYGYRPDDEEDAHAERAALEVARGMREGTLPPFIGIRVKPLNAELHRRAVRTLDIFLTTLAAETRRELPPHFVVTLPKVVIAEQVTALAELLELLEEKNGLAPGAVKVELMVEMPQAVINERGEVNLLHLLDAARGRCVAAQFGAYDYTASCAVTGGAQSLQHPACDFARAVMQAALAGTGVWLVDGATTVMPVEPTPVADGASLTSQQFEENQAAVHRAWRLHYDNVQYSLRHGFYQSWDLHAAQLPARYAAVYAFYLENLDAASARLKSLIERAAQATLVGGEFDDVAGGQGLLNFFLRAVRSGAITEAEAESLTGLSPAELRAASFVKILDRRRA